MLDHLIYGARDLDAAINDIEQRLGGRAAYGGKHAGGLTHNALLSLGQGSYLELIAPVPGATATDLPFGLDSLTAPHLITWAMAVDDIERTVHTARTAGYDPGEVAQSGRELPDGSTLSWRFAVRPQPSGDGLVPFLIQWLSEPHPSTTSPQGCRFVSLRGEHPDPTSVRAMLDALSVDLAVTEGSAPRLIATLDTPNGRVELS